MEQVSKRLQSQRNTRMRRREQGLCIGCGCSRDNEKFIYCQECRHKDAERKRNSRSKSEETIKKDRARVNAYKKKREADRRENGLCVECGIKPPKENRMRCADCLKKRAEESAEYRVLRKRSGLCVRCGKNKVYCNDNICERCTEEVRNYHLINYEKRKEYQKEYRQERAEKLKAKGICVRCGKHKAKENRTQCHYCLSKVKEYYESKRQDIARSERPAYGRCYLCGNELDREGGLCKSCAEKSTINLNRDTKNHVWRKDNRIVFKKRSVCV